jgi:microprocessor complex subunit DGCR8
MIVFPFQQIHPHVKNFGSFLRLYGNGSIKSVKIKKQEEQQITTLQSKASANSPNYAILAKLREEMRKLIPPSPASVPVVDVTQT